MLIKRVTDGTERAIWENFRQGRGCMDQVFAVWQVCERSLANLQDVYWAFMDFE